MSNVNKIVELILSDDETNQELGCMMAVSQGLKDEVLKECRKKFIILLNNPILGSGYKIIDYSNHYSVTLGYVFSVEAHFKTDGVLSSVWMNDHFITSKANTIRKLKNIVK